MNILNVEKVTKGYGNRTLFENIILGINEGDKTGVNAADKNGTDSANSKEKWKEDKKNSQPLKFSYAEQKEFDTIEEDIEKLEIKIKQIDDDILRNATNSGRLNELTKEREALENTLNVKMERWVYLNEPAEEIQSRK